jgi:predicted SprT family Zn-dependent metalloprotease
MDIIEARKLALSEMETHGLIADGWTFKFDRAVRRAGVCSFSKKEIRLSTPITLLNSVDEIRDTVLHEAAHALAGHKAGHGPEWKRIAQQIGARPERTYGEEVAAPPAPWLGTCIYGHTTARHRLTQSGRRTACGKCCNAHNGGRWSATYLFDWTRVA